MKKSKQVFTIGFVIVFFLSVAVFTFFNGIKPHENHYIRIEVNPKVEFLTDIKNKVTSLMPLNEEAKTLLIQENFIGLNIEDATEKFIDLCAKANYLDCEKQDNAIRISIVSGFMQILEMNVYKSINNYLMENEIFAIIVENDNDLEQIKQAKKLGVSTPNKLAIINSIIQLDSTKNFKDLKNKKETSLLQILEELHLAQKYSSNNYTKSELANKAKLIDSNRTRLAQHKKNITNKTSSKFQSDFDEYKRLNTKKYEPNFDESYNLWKDNIALIS